MKLWWTGTLLFLCPLATSAQVAILQIQVVEGEGTVHAPGARSSRPLTVAITDETGRPASGAAVSFTLPDEGPGGTFTNGLRTEVLTADARGRATLRGLQANRIPGRFQIRITTSLEQARAGTVSFQYVAGVKEGAGPAPATAAQKTKARSRWPWIAVVVGAAAAGGIVAGSAGSPHPSAAAPQAPAPTLAIGSPGITVGRP